MIYIALALMFLFGLFGFVSISAQIESMDRRINKILDEVFDLAERSNQNE